MFFQFVKSKPRPPMTFKLPEDGRIFLRPGEDPSAFELGVKYQNFMAEMMKFFPNLVDEGLQTGTESTFNLDGVGYYTPELEQEGRGFDFAGRIDGDYLYRYGDFHNVFMNNKRWGYGAGKYASNLDFTPSASEFDHFSDLTPMDYDATVNNIAYSQLLYGPGSTTTLGNLSGYWDEVKAYLARNFNDKSYYEIALTGVANSEIIDGDGDYNIGEVQDGRAYNVTHNGGFLYDGTEGSDGLGAFYLMLAMLESRRRINYAMSEVVCPAWMLDDTLAARDYIENTFNDPDKLKGFSSYNRRIFMNFLGIQHAFRAIIPAFSGGAGNYWDMGNTDPLELCGEVDLNHFNQKDIGFAGYGYSARDQVAFQRLRHWMANNVESAIRAASDEERPIMQNLWDEFRFVTDQPYGASELVGTEKKYMGWDRFHSFWGDGDTPPFGASPLLDDGVVMGGWHPNYAVAQLGGLSREQALGLDDVEGINLYNINWVDYFYGNSLKWEKQVTAKISGTFALNNWEKIRFRKQNREFRKWKVEDKQRKIEEKIDAARGENKVAERREAEKAKNGKHNQSNQASNHRNTGDRQVDRKAELKKAMKILSFQMFKRMMDQRKQGSERNKKAREAEK